MSLQPNPPLPAPSSVQGDGSSYWGLRRRGAFSSMIAAAAVVYSCGAHTSQGRETTWKGLAAASANMAPLLPSPSTLPERCRRTTAHDCWPPKRLGCCCGFDTDQRGSMGEYPAARWRPTARQGLSGRTATAARMDGDEDQDGFLPLPATPPGPPPRGFVAARRTTRGNGASVRRFPQLRQEKRCACQTS